MSQTKLDALQYFPESEMWRLQTDGWQATQGPNGFRQVFYRGMEDGFRFIFNNIDSKITPELIEEIYLSAFSYESDFASEDYQRGYNIGSGTFEIFLNLAGLENEAAVSPAGIPELAQSVINFEKRKSNCRTKRTSDLSTRFLSQVSLIRDLATSQFTFDNEIDPLSMTKHQLEDLLSQDLKNAALSKEVCKLEKDSSHVDTSVSLFSNKASREKVIQWIQEDINAYNQELAKAKTTKEKIAAIVRFIRQLHQAHYFPDGNGRTFVFLLQNLLFLQNRLGLKMTTYPAHFGGYSIKELTNEADQDMKLFKRYSVKDCQDYLISLSSEDIFAERDTLKESINRNLDQDPLIAMAQLNEIYKRILDEEIRCPSDLILKKETVWSFFFRNSPQDLNERKRVLNTLQILYLDKLTDLRKNLNNVPPHSRVGYGYSGSAFYLMPDLPSDLSQYKQSYIYIRTNENDQTLYYIKPNCEVEPVTIKNFKNFETRLEDINPLNCKFLHLGDKDLFALITHNGGHAPSGENAASRALKSIIDKHSTITTHLNLKALNRCLIQYQCAYNERHSQENEVMINGTGQVIS